MPELTIKTFLFLNDPFTPLDAWLLAQPSMAEAWNQCTRPDWLLWIAPRAAVSADVVVGLAGQFAAHVLPAYEREFPTDMRLRQALEYVTYFVNAPVTRQAWNVPTRALRQLQGWRSVVVNAEEPEYNTLCSELRRHYEIARSIANEVNGKDAAFGAACSVANAIRTALEAATFVAHGYVPYAAFTASYVAADCASDAAYTQHVHGVLVDGARYEQLWQCAAIRERIGNPFVEDGREAGITERGNQWG